MRKTRSHSIDVGETQLDNHLTHFTILLKESQKKFLSSLLPWGISLQRHYFRMMLEIDSVKREARMNNAKIEKKTLKKSISWMANMSQSSNLQSFEKDQGEGAIKKRDLVSQLLSKIKKMINKDEMQGSNYVAQWQLLLEKVQNCKEKYVSLLSQIKKYVEYMKEKKNYQISDVLFDHINAEMEKTRELLSEFPNQEAKIQLPQQIERKNHSYNKNSLHDKQNLETQISKEKKYEKRMSIKSKKHRKEKAKKTNTVMMCDETTLSPILEEVQPQTNEEQTISFQQEVIINELLRKLTRIDQDILLSTLSIGQKTFLIRNLKKAEAHDFLSKIKQTLRKNGINDLNLSYENQEKESSFEIESQSD